jgi:hypothetical protein
MLFKPFAVFRADFLLDFEFEFTVAEKIDTAANKLGVNDFVTVSVLTSVLLG